MHFRFSSAEDLRARDIHRAATIFSLLVFMWGVIATAVVPSEPFWIANTAEIALGSTGLAYLVWTWNRPRRGVAAGIFAIQFVYAILVLPWTTVVWCQLGRPLEAFVVPQIGILSIALVFPGRWSFGVAAMSIFVAESLFVFVYARHVGLGALIPVTEPLATTGITILGIGLLSLRQRRRDLAREYIRTRAEIQALDRIRPLLVHARTELEAQVAVLATEVPTTGENLPGARTTSIGRALDRLGDLGRRLGGLVADESSTTSPQLAEQRLLERDAQLGAMLFAGLAAALTILAALFGYVRFGVLPITIFAAIAVELAILSYLVHTRRRPSSRRALWAVLVLWATTIALVTYNQIWMLRINLPFAPFLDHKLLMIVLGLTLATRFRLGVVLILATAANAIALWFALDFGAHRDIVSVSEPWATLTFTLIGLFSLRLLEQRQIASVRLLRDEAAVSAMHRRALLFLALRDRLNTPLQTLVLGAAGTTSLPTSDNGRVQVAIDRLVELSRELSELDVLVPRASASLDANDELRRHS